jgi:hypothetical protein
MDPSIKIEHKYSGVSLQIVVSPLTRCIAVFLEDSNRELGIAINLSEEEGVRLTEFLVEHSEYVTDNAGDWAADRWTRSDDN